MRSSLFLGESLRGLPNFSGHPIGKWSDQELEQGVKSTLWCHLGNIAWRTGHTLNIDPTTGRILGDQEANKLWTREYRKGWEPKV